MEAHQETASMSSVCNLSREEIRANRKLKRAAKKEKIKLEKQKERERKRYEDILNGSKSEKVKLIREEEYRRYLVENEHTTSGSEQTTRESQSFHLEIDEFPNLAERRVPTNPAESPSENEPTTLKSSHQIVPLGNNTTGSDSSGNGTFAQDVLKAKADIVLSDENSFPKLNEDGSSQRSAKTQSNSSQITLLGKSRIATSVVDRTKSERVGNSVQSGSNQKPLANELNQSLSDQTHLKIESNLSENTKTIEIRCDNYCPDVKTCETALTKSDLNENMNNDIKTKPDTCEAKQSSSSLSERKIGELGKYKRRPYCCNLLQYTKIKPIKSQLKFIRKRKTTTLPSHNEGNALDSTKPLKMNRGKHYIMRDKVIRKNKKRITKAKKIICNYRKLKNDSNFVRIPNLNIFITREFLNSLIQQMERDFKFNDPHEKQNLLFNLFTTKKNKNKLWDNMREYIKSNAERLKVMEFNDRKDNCNKITATKEEIELKQSMKSDTDVLVDLDENSGVIKDETYQNDVCNSLDNVKTGEILSRDKFNCDTKDTFQKNLCKNANYLDNLEVDRNYNEPKTTNSEKISINTVSKGESICSEVETMLEYNHKEETKSNTGNTTNEHTVCINTSILTRLQCENGEESRAIKIEPYELKEHVNKKTNTSDKQITSTIDKRINETSPNNQITNSKNLKRLEKKKQRRQSAKLDETIVAGEDMKLDLNKIVDVVVKTEDVDQLCSVKQKMHSRHFRPYCNHLPLPRLRQVSTHLIRQIVLFQERLFKSDPLKGRTKRRYLVGMKEVLKCLPIRNKVKMLFIAPDLECVPSPGGIDDSVQSLLTMATIQGVPYLFSIPRRTLGSLTHKPATSCLGVLDYSGCEEMAEEIISLISQARTMYDARILTLSTQTSTST